MPTTTIARPDISRDEAMEAVRQELGSDFKVKPGGKDEVFSVERGTLSGAKVHLVPLVKGTYAHDVRAMVAADPNAGVLYICNPNNPTGTLTSREDIQYALENKPKGSILLIDEAYLHFSDATPSLDLVRADKEVHHLIRQAAPGRIQLIA